MTATKWEVLQTRFLKAHASTGISVKAWCEKNQLNYDTAWRHIKANTQTPQLTIHKIHHEDNVQKKPDSKCNYALIQSVNENKVNEFTGNDSVKNAPLKKRVASLGNQNARTFGHYSEFITTDEDVLRHNSALRASLCEELTLTRMQQSNLMVEIKRVEAAINGDLTNEQRSRLYSEYAKLHIIFDIKIARIESLSNSLISQMKMKADIDKSIALTRKVQLQADKLSCETGDSKNTLDEIYDEILAMGSDGMINK